MRYSPRIVIFLLAGLLAGGEVKAHMVDWMENPWGDTPANAMVFYYPREFTGHFWVDRSYYEPCTVIVNLNASTSTLVNAQVLPPSPANSVEILVQILRAPSNHLETATITGEWHATGFPLGYGCDAISPNRFSVPISVTDQTPYLQLQTPIGSWINLNGKYSVLQYSPCLSGPWLNLALGQTYSIRKPMAPVGYFRQTKVTVTPPGGVPFAITPGPSHHHNSGPSPASGTWTVTAVVCGLTKTATVTVP